MVPRSRHSVSHTPTPSRSQPTTIRVANNSNSTIFIARFTDTYDQHQPSSQWNNKEKYEKGNVENDSNLYIEADYKLYKLYKLLLTCSTCWASFTISVSFVTRRSETFWSNSASSFLKRFFFVLCDGAIPFKTSYIAPVASGMYLTIVV